jgi:hypothetical protein
MRRMPPACCARAASGHAAAPPSSVMNSRRLILLTCIRYPELVQGSITHWGASSQGLAALRDFDPVFVGLGSKARITAPQHCCPLSPQ